MWSWHAMWFQTADPFVVLPVFLVWAGLYFLPSIVAFSRHHQNRVAILIINFVFGFTVIGWIVALIWSLTRVIEPKRY